MSDLYCPSEPPGRNRTYTPQEWAAARRVGIAHGGTNKKPRGPLIHAGGDYYWATDS